MAGEIVIGYDGTESAQAALGTALELAKDTGSNLVIAYGYDPTRMGGEVRDLDLQLEERGREVTNEAAEKAKEAGVEAETAVVKEKPSAALAELAKTLGARFIVVGSYGERPITGAILGSTPHKLLHIAEVPVVVVPPPR
jgi:nucleotide-binding universal stress UspA family protein